MLDVHLVRARTIVWRCIGAPENIHGAFIYTKFEVIPWL